MTYYTSLDSPLGRIILVGGAEALTGCYFDGQRYQPPHQPHWRAAPELPLFREAASQLLAYFQGTRQAFTVPLALEAGTPFQQRVWRAIAAVPFGRTSTYRELAHAVESPGAIRAAGTATGRNPHSIFIPCHRILGSDGGLTGYAGGLERKAALLRLEGVLTETQASLAFGLPVG